MLSSQTVFSVSQLNTQIKSLLENNFSGIWLEAEISNLTKAASGHWYFSLKDENAQVRCAMFRMANRKVTFPAENGTQVLVRANASLYQARGEYQLIVESMQPAGIGRLQQAFEALKTKLQNQGLFDLHRKKPLPTNIRKIAIVTSAKGAAIHDMLSILNRRARHIEIDIYPCLVQGESAAKDIAEKIKLAQADQSLDLIIVGRGGGSLEDLWAFNEEQTALAIASCPLPVISAVGHETDITIADFVADIRAATPSAAAEIISQNCLDLAATLPHLNNRLTNGLQQTIRAQQNRLLTLKMTLSEHSPQQKIRQKQQWLDEQEWRINEVLSHKLTQLKTKQQKLSDRFAAHSPLEHFYSIKHQLAELQNRLTSTIQSQMQTKQNKINLAAQHLHAISPLATFERGYSATYNQQKQLIKSVKEVLPGEEIQTQLKDGFITSKIINSRSTTDS
ncbi:exodeoxyribonuclease VII large subunit [Catenovulum sediminis]|uniref:exodeoxyribonuclease VII large subunit n=1 Tax=Catenovulum sediminis TaxID=1740262 RepID=UPI00117ECC2A|nr:exodeoxyribonuclease VII large subunit [Catenovulum sediminis]